MIVTTKVSSRIFVILAMLRALLIGAALAIDVGRYVVEARSPRTAPTPPSWR